MNDDEGSILQGLLICWGLTILAMLTGFLSLGAGLSGNNNSLNVAIVLIGGIGLLQLVYVVPIYFVLKKKGKADTIKGLIIAASITAFMNATCWGLTMGH